MQIEISMKSNMKSHQNTYKYYKEILTVVQYGKDFISEDTMPLFLFGKNDR